MQEDSNSVLVSASSSRRRSDCATSSSSSAAAAAAAFSFGAGNMRAGILIELESCHCFSPLFTFFPAATSASLSLHLPPAFAPSRLASLSICAFQKRINCPPHERILSATLDTSRSSYLVVRLSRCLSFSVSPFPPLSLSLSLSLLLCRF